MKKHKHSLFHRENIRALSKNLVEASGLSGTSFEPLLSEEHLLKNLLMMMNIIFRVKDMTMMTQMTIMKMKINC